MNRLTLTCTCGRELAVPESALHQVGLCPYCGAEIPITEQNTRAAEPPAGPGRLLSMRQGARRTAERTSARDEQSWRKFAEAVDLYNARRHAEALTLLNALAHDFPGNPHVDEARAQCVRALQQQAAASGQYGGEPLRRDVLSPELVKSAVLDKLVNSRDEQVQLRAAEIAARLLGMYGAEDGEAAREAGDEAPPAAILRKKFLPQVVHGGGTAEGAPRARHAPRDEAAWPEEIR